MAIGSDQPSREADVITKSRRPSRSWRTVDAVVVAVIGVAFAVVFAVWNVLYSATAPAFSWFPPAQGVIYGVWMLPGVLAALIIRKPGAAFSAEVIAAFVSVLLGGGAWSWTIVLYGLIQGLAPEAVFALFRYRRFDVITACFGGGLAGLGAAVMDVVGYYPDWSAGWKLSYTVVLVVSSAVIAGLGGLALARALTRTGVLAPFASARGIGRST
jgi:energy-coupling factor transport system substrate-specific component